jgi:stage II sporulation protein D
VDTLVASAPRIVTDSDPDEITDENYHENNIYYGNLTTEELDEFFPEDIDLDEYKEISAGNSGGKSSSSKTSDKDEISVSFDSGDVTADDINHKHVGSTDNDDEDEELIIEEVSSTAETAVSAELPEVSDNYSWSDIIGQSESGTTSSVSFGEDGCGETLTAKVHGEVQEFDAYELVCMIVANEMSPSFNVEALKAQAVAAYSYVKYHNVKGLTATVLVKEDVPDAIKSAVASVWGQCCYYNGSVAQTVYTASTSGYTASSTSVWGGDSVPYLTSKECSFDRDYDPNYGAVTTYSESDIKSRLENYLGITLSDNPANWLTVTEYQDGNYVRSVNVDGQTTISGIKLRENVLGYGIKSAAFKVSYADGTFTFTTYGYGHGVGMSQNGANILAKQGYTYIDILKFYYEGITIG